MQQKNKSVLNKSKNLIVFLLKVATHWQTKFKECAEHETDTALKETAFILLSTRFPTY